MANPNAPHGAQPVAYINGAPWTGKANLYRIPSANALAFYIGDFVTTIGTTTGGDALGVPDVTRAANGAVTSQQLRGVIVGVQVAPIGAGAPGAAQGGSVNLNILYVPATKANDYYVWVADDPNLVFEIQGDNAGTLVPATGGGGGTLFGNAGYNQAAPSVVTGPVSGTTLTTGTINVTSTLPLKILSLPYRPNVGYTANTPFLVEINTHELGHGPGTTAV
jgi:hypothetical protein